MADAGHLTIYKDALIVLSTAGVVVPVMQRLKITPVLGYLAAGALLGPKGLGALAGSVPFLSWVTIGKEEHIAGLAELGVVFLLFVIGLELSLQRLRTMRRLVFGLGTLQVVLTSLAIGVIAPFFGNSAEASALIGVSLALSSTAIIVELLAKERKLNTLVGRSSFAILLLQDLAVVPMMFLVDLLGAKESGPLVVSLLLAVVQALAIIVAIIAIGLILLRPLFRMVAQTDSPELFVAATLLVVLGTGVLAAGAGLSMGLGAFVAGLMLAETEYRKAIEATIEPFKGLLLGVFFISVGMKLDLGSLLQYPVLVFSCAVGLIALKAAVLAPLGHLYGAPWPRAVEIGLTLGSGGEFSFIIVGLAMAEGLLTGGTGTLLLTVTALTMAAIPLLVKLGETVSSHFEKATPPPETQVPLPEDGEVRAIVIGCGRVGQLISDMLTTHDMPHLIVENDPHVVARVRALGRNAYYGDAKVPLFLKHCGIDNASALIITINAQSVIDEIVAVALDLRSDIVIVSRARDADHARRLYSAGVTDAVPETIEASLQLSEAALVGLGVPTGPVIASIHEKRDEFRRELQQATGDTSRPIRGIRAKVRRQQQT